MSSLTRATTIDVRCKALRTLGRRDAAVAFAWVYKGDSRAALFSSFSFASVISEHREKRDAGCDVTATPHICVHTATRAIARRRNNLVATSSLHASDPPRRLVFESFLELLTYLRTKPAQASSTVYQNESMFRLRRFACRD